MKFNEANFDGLVGPTHNYAGLSLGNVASLNSSGSVSNPREAALQGLQKMKALADLGLVQGVLPPQQRPDLAALRNLGFSGSDSDVVEKAYKKAPHILSACYSASSMWTANAATVSPSPDTADGRVHFTPANLCSKFHRSIEHETTGEALKAIFTDENHFAHHPALRAGDQFSDEGAANHTRFCQTYGHKGVEFFVFGRYAFDNSKPKPEKFPARQTLEASQSIARLHGLSDETVIYAQQNPEVIDAGVFHNDVISVGNQNVLFCHEKAFAHQSRVLDSLREALEGVDTKFQIIEVPDHNVSVEDAVTSYLFNSQLVTLPDDTIALIAPEECQNNKRVWDYLTKLKESGGPVKDIKIYDVKQSMRNGGGPACLRLRVVLSEEEQAAVNDNCFITDDRFEELNTWVNKHYRDRIEEKDLADPKLILEVRQALDELTQVLDLGSIYPFQIGHP